MPKGIPTSGINKGWFKPKKSKNNYKGHKIYYDKKGYATIWLNGKNIKVHVLVWEEKNGEKPPNLQIHHIDENKKNYNINNLQLVTPSDHLKIHAGWKKNKQNQWISKPCKDCKKTLPLNKFYPRKGLTPSNRCIVCSKLLFKKLNKTKKYRESRKKYSRQYYLRNKHKWRYL